MNKTFIVATLMFGSIATHAQTMDQITTNTPYIPPQTTGTGLEMGADPSQGWGAIRQSDITPSNTATVRRLNGGSVRIDAHVPTGTVFWMKDPHAVRVGQ